MKKVSVIIPVYNVEEYLAECIESVLNQTYMDFELILVNDGSKDKSGEICDRYALNDSRINVIHKENGGASSARNIGIETALGDYIYYLDSDDILEKNAIECLVTSAENSKANIVFFEADSFGVSGYVKDGNYHYKKKYEEGAGKAVLESLVLNKEFHVSTPLLFTRRSFLAESGVRFKEGIMYEDMIYTFELFCKAEKICHLDKTLYRRRYREASVMTNKKNKHNFKSALAVYYEVLDFAKRNKINEKRFFKKYITRWSMNCLNVFRALSAKDKKDCKDVEAKLKASLKNENFFDDKSLKYRCIGYLPWVIYKLFSKITGVFRK